jgi:hypothetical protein
VRHVGAQLVRCGCRTIRLAVEALAGLRGGHQPARDRSVQSRTSGRVSVDGLLVLATAGLFKPGDPPSRRARIAVWSSFLLGIAVSLAANITAAPTLVWQSVLVAGWPPIALLLAVELLAHRSRPWRHNEITPATYETESAALIVDRDGETATETRQLTGPTGVSPTTEQPGEPSAQEVMWAHVQREQARGRLPTGAELDRVAGTNNYGRTVLRQWREQGRLPSANGDRQVCGGVA